MGGLRRGNRQVSRSGSTRASTPPQPEPQRVLKVRLIGSEEDCAAAAAELAPWTIDRFGPRPCRREAGVRLYLTLLIHSHNRSASDEP